ncbi:MAG: S1C family serine protease [Oscillospiraceae bacterium]|nr:S1C family serine protease [Oscillospiraceae bacterium]
MPEHSTRRPADWYNTSPEQANWYKDPSHVVIPQPAEAGCSTHQPPPRSAGFEGHTAKRRRRTKIISLSVCALLLCAALAVALWQITVQLNSLSSQTTESAASNPVIVIPNGDDSTDDSGSSSDSGSPYDSYQEYFEAYYSTSSEITIPAAETGSGVTLTLAEAEGNELSLQDIYDKVSPAVVGITAYIEGYEYSYGTGVVFASDGYIITNTHVLEGCDAAVVKFSDGTEYDAYLVGSDDASDIAVLYIEGENFPYAEFGDSDDLRVGDQAIAIGNPLGETYSGTMTNGIISAINRNITYNGHTMTLLQTNAALNEGNSGGPLINAYGQVIGITNMKIMSTYYATVEGIGFAIPSSVVKEVADQLLEYGTVLGEPTIGIVAGSVSAEAMALYGLPEGIYVSEVNEGSDALEKGLQVGDVITAVNGEAVTSVADVNLIKEGYEVGDTITLTVYRDGETFELEIELVDKSQIE